MLEQGLWRNLALAGTTAQFARAWLELACRTVAGTAAAALWIRIGDGPVEHYVWPANAAVDPGLAAAAARMDAEARGTVQPGATPQRPTRLAYPAVIDGRTVGGIAMTSRRRRDAMRGSPCGNCNGRWPGSATMSAPPMPPSSAMPPSGWASPSP